MYGCQHYRAGDLKIELFTQSVVFSNLNNEDHKKTDELYFMSKAIEKTDVNSEFVEIDGKNNNH